MAVNERFQRFVQMLKVAYQSKSQGEFSPQWHWDVMRDIRHLGPLNASSDPYLFTNRFVWRFATVACAIALILSVYVVYAGLNPDTGVVTQILDNPVEFMLVQAVGGY